MSNLVIIFPGIGYTAEKPLLYYGLRIAKEENFDECIKLSYKSKIKGDFRSDNKVRKKIYKDFYKQTIESLSEVKWNEYEKVVFISKSIGTVIAANYAFENKLTNVKHVFYTPLNDSYKNPPKDGIAFIGTRDQFSNYEEIVDLSKNVNIPISIFKNCNHSLECEDCIKNIEILNDIMKSTKNYLKEK